MNTEFWKRITDFDFDEPNAEYCFSVRLADENKWTVYFTEQAILEYKKFMYLAAISDEMVSPSEIVDIVWHQHLIFTKSYNEFCKLLNKKIEHIPSTHNANQKEIFVRAKQRTTQLYEAKFGKQPAEFWLNSNITDSINIPSATRNNNYVLLGILIAFLILSYPASIVLRPVLVTIDNPQFLIGYILIILLAFISLVIYNKHVQNKLASNCLNNTILANLRPEELIHIKTNSVSQIIHSIVNKLVVHNHIGIADDFKIKIKNQIQHGNQTENVIINYIHKSNNLFYPQLVKDFEGKQIIGRFTNAAFHLNFLYKQSKSYANMVLVNFTIFLFVFLIGSSRMIVGISRDKPVIFLAIVLILYVVFIALFQKKRSIYFTRKAIPEMFKAKFISSSGKDERYHEAEWKYFLLGTTALAFTPLVSYSEKNKGNDGNSSCGTSGGGGDSGGGDGGSCGGGCGGCGGGD